MNTRKILRLSLMAMAVPAVLAVSACAVGNRYDYTNAITALPALGSGSIAVEVVDARPYVLNHDKKPSFIGLQRGGFGNPFDVNTASGRPLTEELREAITKALQQQGYTVMAVGNPPRKMQLTVTEWKSDVMMRLTVNYDLTLAIYDDKGALLAKSAVKGVNVQGGGFESQNATTATREFEARFTELVRDESIRKALAP
jgi:hypothetical protein